MKTLSIRQPWAWLIVNGYKPVENRDWSSSYRGQLFIHASKTLTQTKYANAIAIVAQIDPDIAKKIPPFKEIERGGIVGEAVMVSCIKSSQSPWFIGKFGFVFQSANPCKFYSCKGRLGFFDIDKEAIKNV